MRHNPHWLKESSDDDLAILSKSYEELGIEAIEMIEMILLKKLSNMNIRGTIKGSIIGVDKKNNTLLEFNRKMKNFKILQNSIGIVLGITQASISRALSNNKKNTLLYQEILRKGDKILIEAFVLQNCDYVNIGNKIAPENSISFIKALIHNLDEKQSYKISVQKFIESELFESIDFEKINSSIEEFVLIINRTTKEIYEQKIFMSP